MMFYKFALKEIITGGSAQLSTLTSDIQGTKHKKEMAKSGENNA